MAEFDIRDVFCEEFRRAITEEREHSGFPEDKWLKAGYRGNQDAGWWEEHGPDHIQNFITWYEGSGAQIWITPDGIPAIELGLKVYFGGVAVRMYIDLIVVLGTALLIIDLKSGSRRPDTLTQLGIYASGVELEYGIRPRFGSFFMTRGSGRKEEDKIYLTKPEDLSGYRYSVPFYTGQLEKFNRGVETGIFVAHPGDQCDRCGVAYACSAVGGEFAAQFDPDYRQAIEKGMVH